MHDQELIAGLKSRDEGAFRLVVEKYQNLVLNCGYKFLRSREAAEDLAQDVFVEVYESIGDFRGDAQLSTWIYRIAVTRSLNQIKRQKTKKRFALVVSLFGDDVVSERISSPDSPNPEAEMEQKERAEALARAMDTLADSQRVAYTLSKVEGMSYEEIASVMNTSIPSVESLIHRAKGNLVKHLSAFYKEQQS
jgi:RNA polymerase sigma-70 factor (ECF subfamily)